MIRPSLSPAAEAELVCMNRPPSTHSAVATPVPLSSSASGPGLIVYRRSQVPASGSSSFSSGGFGGPAYIHHRKNGHTILLFCREYRRSRSGLSSPFYFLGPADYVTHEGNRPISITWRLRHPLPAKLYRRMARLAVG
jgi:hypothetical protein